MYLLGIEVEFGTILKISSKFDMMGLLRSFEHSILISLE
nr:MAG TPA: hypothetical protein [Caudoviricetes sp.]